MRGSCDRRGRPPSSIAASHRRNADRPGGRTLGVRGDGGPGCGVKVEAALQDTLEDLLLAALAMQRMGRGVRGLGAGWGSHHMLSSC